MLFTFLAALDLKAINMSSYKGNQKLWTLQHLLIRQIQWSFLMEEILISHASFLDKNISKYIRKWL